MASAFRSEAQAEKYKSYIAQGGLKQGCALCASSPLHTFKLWKVINNDFPYDLVAKVHHMLVPLRHTTEVDLTPEEEAEFKEIKQTYLQRYDYFIEASTKTKSIPAHFHLHLIDQKD